MPTVLAPQRPDAAVVKNLLAHLLATASRRFSLPLQPEILSASMMSCQSLSEQRVYTVYEVISVQTRCPHKVVQDVRPGAAGRAASAPQGIFLHTREAKRARSLGPRRAWPTEQ